MTNEPQTQIETSAIQGDILQHGLSKINNQEHRDLIQWLFYFMSEKKWSIAQTSNELNVSASTLSRIFSGKYLDSRTGLAIQPPATLLATIRRMKELEKADTLKKSAGRIKTPTVAKIWAICRKALCWLNSLCKQFEMNK